MTDLSLVFCGEVNPGFYPQERTIAAVTLINRFRRAAILRLNFLDSNVTLQGVKGSQ